MIRIDRGDEPLAQRDAREWRLARATLARKSGDPIVFEDYDLGRTQLYDRQQRKCPYCEMLIRPTGQPIEHFRPKHHAIQANGNKDCGRYWWLAWTWENLLLACSTCNASNRKGNHFPLETDSEPLPCGERPPGDERPLLIDPSCEDPMEHIRFVRLGEKWSPVARNGSKRGRTTIWRLGLDEEPGLLDLYQAHVMDRLEPACRRLEEVWGDPNAVRQAWTHELAPPLAPGQPFLGLTYDFLEQRFPPNRRAEHDLPPFPRPGTDWQPRAPSTETPRPELEGLPEQVQVCVRAMGSQCEPDLRTTTLVELCSVRSWTANDLAQCVRRQPTTVKGWLMELVQQGRLKKDGERYCAM